jgi:uncharacterized membrane protein
VHNTYFTLPVLFVMISNHYAMTYGARYNWLVLIAMSFAGACIRGWFVARQKPEGRRGARAVVPAALGVGTLAGLVVALAPAEMPVTSSGVSGDGGPADGSSVATSKSAGALAGGENVDSVSGGRSADSASGGRRADSNSGSGRVDSTPGSGTRGGAGPIAPNGLPTVDVTQVQAIVAQRCVPCHSKRPKQLGFNAPPNGVMLETLDELRAHLPEIQKQVALRAMPLGNLTGMTDDERAKLLMWIGHGVTGQGQGRGP